MKSFGRRIFLGGAAALVGLPWLESLAPKEARAQNRAPHARRFVAFFAPNGLQPERWLPRETGSDFLLSPVLSSFQAHQRQLLLVSGLANGAAITDGDGDHVRGTGTFLTCKTLKKGDGALGNGVSLDQAIVQALNPPTRFPSVQLGLEVGRGSGQCDADYSCAYEQNISWASATTPLPKMIEPRLVFERLFAGTDAKASALETKRRRALKQSVLDHAREDANALAARAGSRDRHKMEEYLTGLRELEQLVQGRGRVGECEVSPPDGNLILDPERAMRAMTELMVAAFQCDLTRIFTFMLGNAVSNRAYDWLGVRESHHELSHHDGDRDKLEQLDTIVRWEVEQLATLAARLAHVEEEDGSALDSTIMLLSSDIVDGNRHDHRDMPVIMAGGSRALRTGQHARFGGDEPLANLYLTVLDAFGVQVPRFGEDGTRVLSELRGGV